MPILYVPAPTETTAPIVDLDPTPIAHRFESWDGSTWDLTNGVSGIYLMAGVRGLTMPPVVHYKQKSPAVAGAFWRGAIVDEREVFWPLKVFTDGTSQEWIDHNRRLSEALLNPMATTRWFATQPGGETRWLDIRFADDGQYAWGADDVDPELIGFAKYGYSFTAEQPYWRGESINLIWISGEEPVDFLDPEAAGDVVQISNNSSVFGAQISNPSPLLSAWPTWTVYGPCTEASLGVGANAIVVPIDLSSGEWIRIDSDPTEQTAVDNAGADVTSQIELVGAGFAAIPPGSPADLNVTMSGSGSVAVSIIPNYYTASAH